MTLGLWAWVTDRILVFFTVIRKQIKREGLQVKNINAISTMFCHCSLCLGEEASLSLTTSQCAFDSSSSTFHLIICFIPFICIFKQYPSLPFLSYIPIRKLLKFLTSQLLFLADTSSLSLTVSSCKIVKSNF